MTEFTREMFVIARRLQFEREFKQPALSPLLAACVRWALIGRHQ
jgi:hypothetical protein